MQQRTKSIKKNCNACMHCNFFFILFVLHFLHRSQLLWLPVSIPAQAPSVEGLGRKFFLFRADTFLEGKQNILMCLKCYWMSGKQRLAACIISLNFFFNQKVFIFFLFLQENLCSGYSKESTHWYDSNEYLQHILLWRNKKNIYLDELCLWTYWPILNLCEATELIDCVGV